MSMLDADADFPGWAIVVVLLTGTISVAGVTDYVLTGAGYDIAGTAVWALCYATALATVWVVWLRDIEFTGPESG